MSVEEKKKNLGETSVEMKCSTVLKSILTPKFLYMIDNTSTIGQG